MSKQFEDVNCRYGAPMGRNEYGYPTDCEDNSIRLFKVNLTGGYDDGGAYWGWPNNLYCATDGGDYQRFTRADSRHLAAVDLNLPQEKLVRRTAALQKL